MMVAESLVPSAAASSPPSSAGPSTGAPVGAKAALLAMGFADDGMLAAVIDKHGDDIEACARDLAAASEWDSLLADLEEMGFHNRSLNQALMLKHAGNIKRAVKDLVEA